MNNCLIITLDSGRVIKYKAERWTDYSYDENFFIVKKCKLWIGMYNVNNVVSVELI